eukprot:6185460-Pleurochrysis_carterae.AAC.1
MQSPSKGKQVRLLRIREPSASATLRSLSTTNLRPTMTLRATPTAFKILTSSKHQQQLVCGRKPSRRAKVAKPQEPALPVSVAAARAPSPDVLSFSFGDDLSRGPGQQLNFADDFKEPSKPAVGLNTSREHTNDNGDRDKKRVKEIKNMKVKKQQLQPNPSSSEGSGSDSSSSSDSPVKKKKKKASKRMPPPPLPKKAKKSKKSRAASPSPSSKSSASSSSSSPLTPLSVRERAEKLAAMDADILRNRDILAHQVKHDQYKMEKARHKKKKKKDDKKKKKKKK